MCATEGDATYSVTSYGVDRVAEAREQSLTAAEEHGRDGDVQLVEETGAQVLLKGGDAAAEPHAQLRHLNLRPG